MVFTRTWDASYEALPASGEDANIGDKRIRDFKVDFRERFEIDHSMAGDANDGAHKKVTLLEQAADPAAAANTGFVYTKDVTGATELFYEDASGNVVQLTDAGNIAVVPSGTKMLFQQTAAPTGWTKITTSNDVALRVVSGTVGSGGTDAFTTVFGTGKATDGHTLTADESGLPAHSHNVNMRTATAGGSTFSTYLFEGGTYPTSSTGGTDASLPHSHTISNLNLAYVDVIIAQKD